MKKLETKEYGIIEYEESDVFHFPDGVFGFPEIKSYLPLCLNEEEDTTVLLLQGIENSYIGFVVINPFYLDPEYNPNITPEELKYLEVSSEEELSFYVICTLKDQFMDNTVNMKCPLLINPETHKGMQVIMSNTRYDYRHKLGSFQSILGARKG